MQLKCSKRLTPYAQHKLINAKMLQMFNFKMSGKKHMKIETNVSVCSRARCMPVHVHVRCLID